MFTGIIDSIGIAKKIVQKKDLKEFMIESKSLPSNIRIGESLNVNGVCLTITQKKTALFVVSAIFETIQKTTLGLLRKGEKLNLEPALKLNDRLNGHLLQGHVDAIGILKKIQRFPHQTIIEIAFPAKIAPYLSYKGSVAINGVSLTISKIKATSFQVALIPYTLSHTNLGGLNKNDQVNIETDMIARYLETILKR